MIVVDCQNAEVEFPCLRLSLVSVFYMPFGASSFGGLEVSTFALSIAETIFLYLTPVVSQAESLLHHWWMSTAAVLPRQPHRTRNSLDNLQSAPISPGEYGEPLPSSSTDRDYCHGV